MLRAMHEMLVLGMFNMAFMFGRIAVSIMPKDCPRRTYIEGRLEQAAERILPLLRR